MSFEEMRSLWNSQIDDELFAINETELHAYIKRKSKTIRNLLEFFESVMIVLNLVAGILLIFKLARNNESAYQLILPLGFIIFSVYSFFRHLIRRTNEVQFKPTILGELDKAIWQIDYLIRQGRSMTLRYALPLALIVSISAYYSDSLLWALAFALTIIPASYFGTRWEINKWYLPKKRALESLREKLTTQETR